MFTYLALLIQTQWLLVDALKAFTGSLWKTNFKDEMPTHTKDFERTVVHYKEERRKECVCVALLCGILQ